ncbi:ATPase [Lachnoclostridium sp. An14]|uniref:V-type ATP synthase subunit I n=1 Tax=Lachnoclostridium sp. An14 TaxID=1965562 RepID=UPI000B39A5F3|nr:V-type ATPase 116kDa subunit family protein [Lachnoclostridium sp. An14]OUQ12149.1 ATPase [Lachnoclostridium sp. An14]
MIEPMKFISITGPKADIDRVVDRYLSKYEVQLENALAELRSVKDLRPFTETNPYKEMCAQAEALAAPLKAETAGKDSRGPAPDITLDEALDIVARITSDLDAWSREKEDLEQQVAALEESRERISPFTDLNYNLSAILHFKYIQFRFGRIPKEYFRKFTDYVYDTIDTVYYKCSEEDDYVWIVYFVPESISKKIDAIYASMHFERYMIPDEYEGTPLEAGAALDEKINGMKDQIAALEQKRVSCLEENRASILAADARLSRFAKNFDVRRMAACTRHKDSTFYILCGWMTKEQADAFREDIKNDEDVFLIVEENHGNILSKPPTKLKNPRLFRPFEMFIRMYGLPAYGELDPTILIGITYSFLFGFMFGDAGQGLCLLIGGFLLYRLKKLNLAAIVSCCGFFSTIFGFLFGSVFGFENVIEPLWLRPADAMTDLPFIGKLNTVFVVAISIGMGIILFTMVLNMINSIREKDVEKIWFDTNGAAGLVFYGSVVVSVVLFMSGNPVPAAAVLAVMFGLPLLLMFFKEPLTALLEKKAKTAAPGGKAMFVIQGFFELFEVLLSYFSNTLSFVRVGAFAVSHAAMMEVVLMLAGAEAGSPNWLVIVLGNLFVCGMEGLIVGIQVLRLEYYELFSRFYRGTGREFKPYGRAGA